MPKTAQITLPPKLVDLFDGQADVRGAYGGRGSAKTRSFALMTAVKAYIWGMSGREGIILCGRQYMNSLDDSSLEEIKAAIRSEDWLASYFEIGEKFIRTIDGRIQYKFSGLDRSIASVKSKSRILLCWVDEAEPVTDDGWKVLLPTLREEDSELWVTWNPERKTAPVESRFRHASDPLIKVVEMNWRDNPWFPRKLERERLRDKENRPDDYGWIWEGEYRTAVEGAYFAKQLQTAKDKGRVGQLASDPLMTHRLFVDIGGTGARSDAFAMWVAQFVGREIRCVNYYERVGQPLGAHLEWLRANDLGPENAQFWLPHDGSTNDRVYDVSYESALKGAGYKVTVVPNQGKGAAGARIESIRRMFPYVWFDEACGGGLESLAWYHEKRDDKRDIGLGPEHDWSSHGADAFGLMCLVAEKHIQSDAPVRELKFASEF